MLSSERRTGVLLAGITAVVSGVAVFVNGYGVRAWKEAADASTYTTAKNLVAAAVVAILGAGWSRRQAASSPPSIDQRMRLGLVAIAVIGGAVPFVLFFEGLAVATSTEAAFIHKTLVIWVTVMAVAVLRERIGPVHVAAVVALVWGQAVLAGGVESITIGTGELMILAATLLWSVEVVVAKRVLREVPAATVARVRMIGGSAILVAYTLITGGWRDVAALTPAHVGWVVVTGSILAVYVVTWFSALRLAQAVDVTAVLVGGAVVTALLESGVRGLAPPAPLGVGLVLAAVVVVLAVMNRQRVRS